MGNYSLLISAFDDDFKESIQSIRLKIEKEIIQFLDYLESVSNKEQRFFKNLESRIKSDSSFKEKIRRKDYINSWKITDNKNEIQKTISSNLTDLIGFRINCFFIKDEIYVYDNLKSYYYEEKFSTKIKLSFDEKKNSKKRTFNI